MKKIFISILIAFVAGVIGFFLGQNIGYKNGRQSAAIIQKYRNINDIKAELKNREKQNISVYLKGKADVININEGTLFKKKYVQYFSGSLTNSAVLATAKDVKLNVDFYSKTGSKIGNQEIVIYEFIAPGQSIPFKEKINVPDQVDNFEFQIANAKAD